MFTGIVEELGSVVRLDVADGRARLEVACSLVVSDAGPGDSIAVNGCCLTVTELQGAGFVADLIASTLSATALAALQAGDPVNLERAMLASTRFGGHLVQGHVDTVGTIVGLDDEAGMVVVTVRVPDSLANHIVPKGSITLDGTSLTVMELASAGPELDVRVGLIPHTLDVTTWGSRKVGDPVNVEVDVIAKYVERLLVGGVPTPYQRSSNKDA